jgi:hypothetical protein
MTEILKFDQAKIHILERRLLLPFFDQLITFIFYPFQVNIPFYYRSATLSLHAPNIQNCMVFAFS